SNDSNFFFLLFQTIKYTHDFKPAFIFSTSLFLPIVSFYNIHIYYYTMNDKISHNNLPVQSFLVKLKWKGFERKKGDQTNASKKSNYTSSRTWDTFSSCHESTTKRNVTDCR